MADIKLILTGINYEIDVAQDRQFPLSLNYSSGSLSNIEDRSTDFSLEFRIPANKNNKTALSHMDSTNIEDGNDVLHKTPCTILADGIPVLRGDFKLLGKTNDRGFEEFKCIVLGAALDWLDGMRTKTPRDYTWDTLATYSKSVIENYWHNSGTSRTAVTSYNNSGITFPLISYGAWYGGRRVLPNDLRPAMFMRSFFQKAFEAEGYTVQMDTDADDFFHTTNNPIMDKIIFPFTGDQMKTRETDKTTSTFESTNSVSQNLSWSNTEDATWQLLPQTSQGDRTVFDGLMRAGTVFRKDQCVRYFLAQQYDPDWSDILTAQHVAVVHGAEGPDELYINTPEGQAFEIIGYGRAVYPDGTGSQAYYIDLKGDFQGIGRTSVRDDGTYGIFNVSIVDIKAGEEDELDIAFDTTDNATVFNTTTDQYTAPENIKASFNFSCKFICKDGNVPNRGKYKFYVVRKKASDSSEAIIGSETVQPTDTSAINEYEDASVQVQSPLGSFTKTIKYSIHQVSFDTETMDLETGDTVFVKVWAEPDSVYSVYNELIKAGLQTWYQTIRVDGAKLTSQVSDVFSAGVSNVVVSDLLDDRFTTIEYIKGCIHAFNLMIKTDPLMKKVIIKTRDSFYKDKTEAVDWTNKIDAKKQYEIEYLDFYRRDIKFSFQRDNADGYMKELNKESEYEYGAYEDSLDDRFQEGIQLFQNPLFAYTHHRSCREVMEYPMSGINGRQAVFTARMWNQYSGNSVPPPVYYKYRPRILIYEYVDQNVTWNWGETGTHDKVPTALPNDLDNGRVAGFTQPIHLGYNSSSVDGLFHNFYQKTISTIEKGTRLNIPLKLKYRDIHNLDLSVPVYFSTPEDIRGYWIIDMVENYLPTTVLSTNVQLIKLEDFSARTNDTNQDSQSMDDVIEFIKDNSESRDEGRGGGIDKTDRVDTPAGGKNAMGGEKWDSRGGSGSGRPKGPFNPKGQSDAQDYSDSRNQSKQDNFTNPKNITDAERYDASYIGNREEHYGTEKGSQNAVLDAKGNQTVSGGGNFIAGRDNQAWGRNQTIMGTGSTGSAGQKFAIGSGTTSERFDAFSVGNDGVVKEGGGSMIEEVSSTDQQVYEEVNGQKVKITI